MKREKRVYFRISQLVLSMRANSYFSRVGVLVCFQMSGGPTITDRLKRSRKVLGREDRSSHRGKGEASYRGFSKRILDAKETRDIRPPSQKSLSGGLAWDRTMTLLTECGKLRHVKLADNLNAQREA